MSTCAPPYQPPALPAEELERMEVLRRLQLLDTAAEERFDRLTRVAAALFEVPIALVSLVDANRQWFKSRHGLGAPETPRDVSFCGHAILHTHTFVVTDSHRDPRFASNPLVTGPPHVRFYAGHPLVSQGRNVGTLCLIDHVPRELDSTQLGLLADLARAVEAELELGRLSELHRRLAVVVGKEPSLVDTSTEVWRSEAVTRLVSGAPDLVSGLMIIDIDGYTTMLDRYGRTACDRVLSAVASRVRRAVRTQDVVGRLGEDQFQVVMPTISRDQVLALAERVRAEVGHNGFAVDGGSLNATVSIGVSLASTCDANSDSVNLARRASAALSLAKRLGRDRVEVDG